MRPLKTIVAIVLAASCMGVHSAMPNIVVILADDLGYGDVACYNPDSKIPTPHLDAMAAAGMRFTDAHSPSAVCSPTRYALLTGTYAWRSRLKSSVLWPWDGPLIDPETPTLPGMLAAAGYDTACIGKWHLGWDWATKDGSRPNDHVPLGQWDVKVRGPLGDTIDFTKPIANGPTTRGFGYYFGDDVPNFPPYAFIENDRLLGLPDRPKPEAMFGSPGPMVEGWDLTEVLPALLEKAVAFIQAAPGEAPFNRRADAPFFLYLPLTSPHNPVAPAPEFIGTSGAHRYGDFVHQTDAFVGAVLAALESAGQLDNTLVIFTSDNGSAQNDGENMANKPGTVLAYGHNPSHIYRGMKADIWEGGHRVPFIAQWPGQIPAGAVSDEVIGHMDLMATVAAITGAQLPEGAARDSYNVLPALRGEARTAPIREATVHHSIHGMFAIRQGQWKYIDGRGSGGWTEGGHDGPEGQLYDLENDPAETTNLYEAHPEIVARLAALLDTYKDSGRSVADRGR
ncbi:MAG: arylsulfatase [Candidatus Hydrogenedentes bacterium]|nr:arylsulfatase [Candidatus Hydrogenedentota bacterium]